jgi:hypothetical protein
MNVRKSQATARYRRSIRRLVDKRAAKHLLKYARKQT